MTTEPNISVIVPILNGASYAEKFTHSVAKTFEKLSYEYELIFVDDRSDDGTQHLLHCLESKHGFVKVIFRTGIRSRSQSIVAGYHNSSGNFLVVTDVDFHPHVKFLPELIDACKNNDCISLATRRSFQNEMTMSSKFKKISSIFCSSFSSIFLRVKITDPLNETFVISRKLFESAIPKLSGAAYRLHLEVVFHSKLQKIVEIMVGPHEEQSENLKTNLRVSYQYICQVLGLLFRVPSIEFVSFCFVGSLGLILHLVILNFFYNLGLSFHISNLIAVICAATNNYILNRFFTFSDVRVQPTFTVKTWFLYILVTAVSLIANTGVASAVHEFTDFVNLSSICGIFIGIFWNFFAGRFVLKA